MLPLLDIIRVDERDADPVKIGFRIKSKYDAAS